MPTNGLLLLDQPIIKGMHICCFCILMQLLTHYDHVIVQPLIVHPGCNTKRFTVVGLCSPRDTGGGFSQPNGDLPKWIEIPERWRYPNAFVQNLHSFPCCSLLEDVGGQEQGLSRCLNHDSFVFSTFMCLILWHLFPSCPNVPLIRMSYSFCVPHRVLHGETLYRH